MKKILSFVTSVCLIFGSCSDRLPESGRTVDIYPDIYPDYMGVTIPVNIAPMNFGMTGNDTEKAWATFSCGDESFCVKEKNNTFHISDSKWKKLLSASVGKSIHVEVSAYVGKEFIRFKPFEMYVSPDSVDGYIAYRRIAPGYELWKNLGIYQRNLSSFKEKAVLENRQTGENCMNCHSFCNRRPDRFLFHMRQRFGGTYLINGNTVEKIDTKTEQTISDFVYPSWHPDGRFVAFSVNKTKQFFHPVDKNRIEVYDEESDVVVYDTEKHEALTTDFLFSKHAFETFPTFSADGKTLYFCSAEYKKIPEEFNHVRYSLCSISFDPENCTFGTHVDTLYSAPREGKSVSFPRVSPDGKYLMFTLSGYGNFSIWHKDADLYLYDLQNKSVRCLSEVNSDDVESYHSWSSSSRWFVFSSRRGDGLYTRPYFAHIAEDGTVSKPFVLPQRETSFYGRFMQSYNIPEFVSGEIKVSPRGLVDKAKENGTGVSFVFVKR